MILTFLIILSLLYIIYNKFTTQKAINDSTKYLQELGINEIYITGSIYQGTSIFDSDIDYLVPYDTKDELQKIKLCLKDLYNYKSTDVAAGYIAIVNGYKIDVQIHLRNKCNQHLEINSIVANLGKFDKLVCVVQKNIARCFLDETDYTTWKSKYIMKGAFDNFYN